MEFFVNLGKRRKTIWEQIKEFLKYKPLETLFPKFVYSSQEKLLAVPRLAAAVFVRIHDGDLQTKLNVLYHVH